MIPLVNVYRGERIESTHCGSIAIADCDGRLLAFAGNPNHRTFLRSAAKPMQVIPLLEEGGEIEYDLTGEEIALMCGSHGGEPFHVSTAAAILRKGDFDESDLRCGAHPPLDLKAAADLRMAGEEPSPLHNNCSGKHAGMLLAAELLDLPAESYVDPDHPLQVRIRQVVAGFLGENPERLPHAIDGCGVPTFYTTLYRVAVAYSRLSALSEGIGLDLPRFLEPARVAVDSMTSHPEFVAGKWSVTTPLMAAYDGAIVAKEGAEAFYAMALRGPARSAACETLGIVDERPIGIAIKIGDGNAARARNPVVARLLSLLGIPVPEGELASFFDFALLNVPGDRVGEVRPEFELEVL